MQREGMSVTTSPREWNMLLFRSCDLSVPAQHTWTCKLAGACLLATCPYYVVPIPKVYVYVLFLLLMLGVETTRPTVKTCPFGTTRVAVS